MRNRKLSCSIAQSRSVSFNYMISVIKFYLLGTHMKKFQANLDISLRKESLCSCEALNSANDRQLATLGRAFLKQRKYTPLFGLLGVKYHAVNADFTRLDL